jgi:hypothetical protein
VYVYMYMRVRILAEIMHCSKHLCVCMHMYVCVCEMAHKWTSVLLHNLVHTNMYICTYVHACIHACMHVCIESACRTNAERQALACVYVHAISMYVNIHPLKGLEFSHSRLERPYLHTHTYIHTYMQFICTYTYMHTCILYVHARSYIHEFYMSIHVHTYMHFICTYT